MKCEICDGVSTRWIEENGCTGYRCSDCQLVMISPKPSMAELHTYYNESSHYGDGLSPELSERVLYRVQKGKSLEASKNLDLLAKAMPTASVLLEIGSGPGMFLQQAKLRGLNPTGLEINYARVQDLRARGFEVLHGSIDDYDMDMEVYDAVYHRDVASHFYDLEGAFSKIYRTLKPGGVMLFETGNDGEYSKRWHTVVGKFHYPGHLYLFSERGLRKVLDKVGFHDVEIVRYSFVFDLFLLQISRLKRLLHRRRVSKTRRLTGASLSKGGERDSVGFEDWAARMFYLARVIVRTSSLSRAFGTRGLPCQFVFICKKPK